MEFPQESNVAVVGRAKSPTRAIMQTILQAYEEDSGLCGKTGWTSTKK
jgi:hypothetical protein